MLPDFEYVTMKGEKVSSKSLAGKVIVLNFWFIACKPCVAEMPMLNDMVQQYKDKPEVVFLALSFDKCDQVKQFLEKTKFNYQAIPERLPGQEVMYTGIG